MTLEFVDVPGGGVTGLGNIPEKYQFLLSASLGLRIEVIMMHKTLKNMSGPNPKGGDQANSLQ